MLQRNIPQYNKLIELTDVFAPMPLLKTHEEQKQPSSTVKDLIEFDNILVPSTYQNPIDESIRQQPHSYTQQFSNTVASKTVISNEEIVYDIAEIPKTSIICTSIELKCNEANVTIGKNKITCNKSILVEFTNGTLKIWTVNFTEKRILKENGESEVVGYTTQDFYCNNLTTKHKINNSNVSIDNNKLTSIEISGDSSTITFDDDFFNDIGDQNKIHIKARHYNTINLGASGNKNNNITFDIQQSVIQ